MSKRAIIFIVIYVYNLCVRLVGIGPYFSDDNIMIIREIVELLVLALQESIFRKSKDGRGKMIE